jgi:transmembrane sensor
MSHLPIPVRKVLDSSADEAALDRVWKGVQRRRAERLRRVPYVRWLGAAAAAAILLLAIASRRPSRDAVQGDSGALRMVDGRDVPASIAPGGSPETLRLSDGSRIEVGAGTRLDSLENGATAFTALLRNGLATFDVTPGGPRRWSIECGMVTVEVVGTRFTVDRGSTFVRVSVERGVVLVRGERVRDRVQRLTVGESLEIDEAVRETTATPALPGPPLNMQQPARRESHAALSNQGALPLPTKAETPASSPTRRAVDGPSIEELLAAADTARLHGRPADAVAPLSLILASHADDSRAALAGFTLGRLELDALSQPSAAAAAFSRAIALGLPESLQETAYARLVEARARAADVVGAKAAASDYLKRFPSGAQADQVRIWADSAHAE